MCGVKRKNNNLIKKATSVVALFIHYHHRHFRLLSLPLLQF